MGGSDKSAHTMRRKRQNVISIVNVSEVSCSSDVGPACDPGEAVELGLVAGGQLCMHWRERGLLLGELFVEIASICASVLYDGEYIYVCTDTTARLLTMVGKYGGGMRLCSTSSKLTSLKNGCLLISSASPLPEPRRRPGSRVNSCRVTT